ncbi:hypothetical protein O9992_00825 [Vibrio lentus]|nr:hypothetical protein [Vibrio lentus]
MTLGPIICSCLSGSWRGQVQVDLAAANVTEAGKAADFAYLCAFRSQEWRRLQVWRNSSDCRYYVRATSVFIMIQVPNRNSGIIFVKNFYELILRPKR